MLLSDSPGIVEKNSYAYLQSLGYEPNVMHLLLMHFLGYVGLPQNSSSRRGCKKKFQHQNFASWHNMGQIMDISKKYTKLVSTKISTLQKGKMKDTTFLGTFSTIWEFSCFRSEKSIEKINIHNVKIWTFRTSSSWENMTHENTHTCNFIQGKGPSFLLCSTCDDECFCYVYTMHHLVFPSKRSTGFSFRWHCPRTKKWRFGKLFA